MQLVKLNILLVAITRLRCQSILNLSKVEVNDGFISLCGNSRRDKQLDIMLHITQLFGDFNGLQNTIYFLIGGTTFNLYMEMSDAINCFK